MEFIKLCDSLHSYSLSSQPSNLDEGFKLTRQLFAVVLNLWHPHLFTGPVNLMPVKSSMFSIKCSFLSVWLFYLLHYVLLELPWASCPIPQRASDLTCVMQEVNLFVNFSISSMFSTWYSVSMLSAYLDYLVWYLDCYINSAYDSDR